MRKLVLLVCILVAGQTQAGVIPSWESQSGKIGFYPISNEVSFYKNVDDAGTDRGQTLQIVSINSSEVAYKFQFRIYRRLQF